MSREIEKINRRALLQILLLLTAVTGLFFSCSILDPMSLTEGSDRQELLEEILLRNRLFNIRKDDEASLISLIQDEDPQVRLAAVKLMEANLSPQVYDALLIAVQDDEEEISSEAVRILLEHWDESYKAVLRGLNSSESPVIYSAIDLIRFKESKEESIYLLTLFDDKRQTVRSRASRVFALLNEYENPWFLQRLDSPDPLVRQTVVETLPRFKNPEIVPFMIGYILDPVAEVRTAAIFGIAEFDREALPALHEVLRYGESKELRLSVLELIEGILEPESIPVLVDMLGDPDPLISGKSAEILFRQGLNAVPELLDHLDEMEEAPTLLAVNLLKRYQDERAVPALIRAFAHESLQVRLSAVDGVLAFREKGFPYLVEALDDPDSRIQYQSLLVLVEEWAPVLVYDQQKGEYPVDRIFYFFENLNSLEVQLFLSAVDLPEQVVTALQNLYEIEVHTRRFKEIRDKNDPIGLPYLYYFRSWENAMISAEISRQNSYGYMHRYFESETKEWLEASRQLRQSSAQFDRAADNARIAAREAGRKARGSDLDLVSSYLESRKALSDSWRALSADVKDMAMLVFLRYSVDIEAIVREYDYFRTLPSAKSATPENL